jgi:hypothetical protein
MTLVQNCTAGDTRCGEVAKEGRATLTWGTVLRLLPGSPHLFSSLHFSSFCTSVSFSVFHMFVVYLPNDAGDISEYTVSHCTMLLPGYPHLFSSFHFSSFCTYVSFSVFHMFVVYLPNDAGGISESTASRCTMTGE